MAIAPHAATGPTHPLYDLWAPVWALLQDCADGTGGFLDGTYIIPHPREWVDHDKDNPSIPTKKLLERRRLARYEKIANLILTLKLDGLFREPATRRVVRPNGEAWETHPYLAWTSGDVDGTGRPLDAVLSAAYRGALTFGHMFLALDRARDDGPTAADRAPLVLRTYRPLDAPDWIDVRGTLTAIKLVEALPRESLDAPANDADWRIYRISETSTTITTVTREGSTDEGAVDHGFGLVPVVPLYAHRPSLTSVLGESALSDPKLYVDLYNLTSETRELLRKQTFSLLNIPLGATNEGGPAISIQEAQALLGQTTGTANVLFSALPANYISAETANVTVYQEERAQLVRTIFRLCKVPFEQDSREAETAEAQREKRKDYSTTLAGYADRLREAELALAQRWYRGTFGTSWERQWAAGTPVVSYPQSFDEPAFSEVLAQAQAALALPLGESKTFRVEHASRLIASFLPDATDTVLQAIRQELEAQPSPAEQRAANVEALAVRFRARDDEDDDSDPPPPDADADDAES